MATFNVRKKSTFKPKLEELEPRLAPAVRWVNSVLDSTNIAYFPGELRSEINMAASGDTIRIVIPDDRNPVIRLNPDFGTIETNKSLTIEASPDFIISPEARPDAIIRSNDSVTINANGLRGFRFFTTIVAPTVTIRGLNITGARVVGQIGAAGSGAGIFFDSGGTLNLESDSFSNDRTEARGGAVAITGGSGGTTVNIDGCSFTNNTAEFNGGAVSFLTNDFNVVTTITGSTFMGNRSNMQGGAISDANEGHSLTIVDTHLWSNQAGDGHGGAIYAECDQVRISSAFRSTIFALNEASESGGAIYWAHTQSNPNATLWISGVEFNSNLAKASGGAVCSVNGATTVVGSLFFDNEADHPRVGPIVYGGGGLYSDGPLLSVANSTFYWNRTIGDGAGLLIFGYANGVTLTSLTVYDNFAAGMGGGVFTVLDPQACDPTIWNCIIASNDALVFSPNFFGSVHTRGFNLIGDAAGSTGWDTDIGSPAPDQVGVANPGLGAFGLFGGNTRTIAVPITSAAYRRGDPGLQTEAAPLNLDQRGVTRNVMVNGAPKVNVGAFDGTVPANNPPIGANNAVTTPRDTAYVFAPADFNFSDPNNTPANNFLAVEITMLPFVGTLTDNGIPVAMGDFVPVSDIAAGYLQFTPPAATSRSPLTSFLFQVQRDGGGADLDPMPRTMTINVTATGVTLIDPGNQYSPAGAYVWLPLTAFGSPGDSLTYTVTGLPTGLDVNTTTGVISGTIDSSASGITYNVLASVFDQTNGSSAWVTFTWTVV